MNIDINDFIKEFNDNINLISVNINSNNLINNNVNTIINNNKNNTNNNIKNTIFDKLLQKKNISNTSNNVPIKEVDNEFYKKSHYFSNNNYDFSLESKPMSNFELIYNKYKEKSIIKKNNNKNKVAETLLEKAKNNKPNIIKVNTEDFTNLKKSKIRKKSIDNDLDNSRISKILTQENKLYEDLIVSMNDVKKELFN